ncbi:MAG: penicillin-insensitive murein endopeptidase [Saccharospirillaceae bacterium]|nr:penicillin-insensitive murein endopeptidase [Pseudomonadales bacterium]NRB80703.1 penicillin-insensitive murein endopeptidase [Saccharospirillaceae bacterium]
MKFLLSLLVFVSFYSYSIESVCYGTASNGSLKNGVQLPSAGKNFVGYSAITRLAGRTYVHSTVKNIVLAAYKRLELLEPNKVYKYAETGYEQGGQFKPHKTHRNGLSVDFMTPVTDKNQTSVHLPTNPLNKFGYNIEFDQFGNYADYKIDYVALAAHIVALHQEAKQLGFDIRRVIFDPNLQPFLFKTQYAEYLKANIQFSNKRSWVRHDEHYHVDFIVPCK